MNWKLLDKQKVLSRHSTGVDHGIERHVLAERGLQRIEWRSGFSYWGGTFEPNAYSPAQMVMVDNAAPGAMKGIPKTIIEGRWSVGKFEAVRAQVAQFLGVPPESLPVLRPKQTWVWE